MGKTKRDTASTAETSFHKHYSTIWGEDRWHNSLYPALAEPTRHAALVNSFVSSKMSESFGGNEWERIIFPATELEDDEKQARLTCLASRIEDPGIEPRAIPSKETNFMPQAQYVGILGSTEKLTTHWNLDAASVLAVHLLGVLSGDNILDLCASPGGKSIAIAQLLWPQLHQESLESSSSIQRASLGSLRSNEFDLKRYGRLNENLKAYLPSRLFESKQVITSRIDGTDPMAVRKLSIGPQGYDKVLVDAPCSSERHIIHAHIAANAAGRSAPEMANWRPGSSKRLVKTQVELLMTGLKGARLGGSVLYATCSIEMAENDGVVERVIAQVEKEVKKGAKWSVKVGFNGGAGNEPLEMELENTWAERTKYGWVVLPDHPAGGKWGPLFFVVFTKVEAPG